MEINIDSISGPETHEKCNEIASIVVLCYINFGNVPILVYHVRYCNCSVIRSIPSGWKVKVNLFVQTVIRNSVEKSRVVCQRKVG